MKTLKLNYRISIYCIAIINVLFYSNVNAQWTQLGQGGGGNMRAIYVDEKPGPLYDFYVGSDVAGVWVASSITFANLTDNASYNYQYISNHEIMEMTNTFYSPSTYTSDFLFVGNMSGIHSINRTSKQMKKILDLPNSWVSDMYFSNGLPNDHRVYFVTGDTRVGNTDETNNSNFKSGGTFDFYWGTMNSGQDNIPSSNLNGINLPNLNLVGKNRRDVFCMMVDEGATAAQADDDFFLGTEAGLYHFNFNQAIGFNGGIGGAVIGPNNSSGYKVTSISKVNGGNQYLLITIYGTVEAGVYLFNKITNQWILLGDSYSDGSIYNLNHTQVNSATGILPITNLGIITGFLLFTEYNVVKAYSHDFNTGVFYKGTANYSGYTVPDASEDWHALNPSTESDLGWLAAYPSANPNSMAVVAGNKILLGRTGFLFAADASALSSAPPNYNITWKQIYTTANNSLTCSGLPYTSYNHKGMVNISSRFISPSQSPSRVWIGQFDRWLWTSDYPNGNNYVQIKKGLPTSNEYCSYLNVPDATSSSCSKTLSLSDCGFATEINGNLYSGLSEGFSTQIGRGFIMEYKPNTMEWDAIGGEICDADPQKIMTASAGNNLYALIKVPEIISGLKTIRNHLFYLDLNNVNATWSPVSMGIITSYNFKDAEITNIGTSKYLLAISGNDIHVYTCNANTLTDITPSPLTLNGAKTLTPWYSNTTETHLLCGMVNSTGAFLYDISYNNVSGSFTATAISGNQFLSLTYDKGITAICHNAATSSLYVATIKPDNNGVDHAYVYRGVYNLSYAIQWEEITDNMPNKSLIYSMAVGGGSPEYLYGSSHGLGEWMRQITYSTNITSTIPCTVNTATATVTANGGTPPYTFSWNTIPVQTSSTATGLMAGTTYTVTVTDANSTVITQTITIGTPTAITLTTSPTPVTCNAGIDGTASVTAITGGLAPYTYLWNWNASGASSITAPAGLYTVTVTDANGCTQSANVTVGTSASTLAVVGTATAVTCNGTNTGSVNITSPAGAVYLWSTGAVTQNLSNVQAGTYTVKVTGVGGCGIGVFTVAPQQTVFTLSTTQNNGCFGSSNASSTVLTNPIIVGLTYQWSNGNNTATASNLVPGTTYSVTVTDASGHCAQISVTIVQPPPLSASCLATSDCTDPSNPPLTTSATVTGYGGTPAYTYLWTGGQTTQTATGLTVVAGTATNYTVTVTDANGCTVTAITTVNPELSILAATGGSLTGTYQLTTSVTLSNNLTLTGCNIGIAADVTITVPANYTLTINGSSYLYACGDMWGGIINSGGTVIIDNSTINDALLAVSTSNGFPLAVTNSSFNNNYISLSYANGSYGMAANPLYGNTFDNQAHKLTKAPYAGVDSPEHIFVSNVTSLTIGNPAKSVNTFHNGLKGIYVEKATVIAKHNMFYNVGDNAYQNRPVYPPPAYVTPNGAIVAIGDGAATYTLTVGGSASNESNTFNGCEVGVAAQSSINTTVSHNDFDLCNSGVILQNTYRCTNLIEYNNMNKYATGISLLDVAQNTSTAIDHNLLNDAMGYDANNEGTVGIDIQNTYPNSDNLTVSYNTVENTQKDVHLLNIGGCLVCDQSTLLIANIHHNTLKQAIDYNTLINGTTTYYGIWAQNGYQLQIKNNPVISWTGTPDDATVPLMKGIDLSDSKTCTVKENTITNFGAGVNVFGYCSRTNLICNEMQYCYNGVYFDPNSTTSLLNTQGIYTLLQSTSKSWDNKWTGNVGTNKIDGNTWGGQFIYWVYDPNATTDYSPLPSAGFIIAPPGDLHNGCVIPMVLDDDERDRMFGSAVGDSTLTDGLDTLEFVNNDEESFFKNSKRDTSILTKGNANDAAFHDKYDSLQQSNIGRFSDVLDSIAVGNNQVALQMLSQITPDNIIETNKKFILTIIATGYNPGLDIDGDTISPITDIANTHPFYGGDAVYWGRGILHLLVKDVLSASRHAQTAATPKNSNQENVLKGKLFPNPTSDAVTFIYPLDKKQNGTVIINDAYNNEIATYKLKQTTLTINALNFSAGVYFLHVYIDDIIAETHRLVIIK